MKFLNFDRSTVEFTDTAISSAARERLLIVVSKDEDCLSRSLVRALEDEFPHLRVVRVATVADLCTSFDERISLLLIDMRVFEELRHCAHQILHHHPEVSVALFQLGDRSCVDIQAVVASRIVRSILPMNLKLDVWLAAIRLILLGGEYFPFALLRTELSEEADHPMPMMANGRTAEGARSAPIQHLTARERQILELVARGLQNKLIAAALGLSEHTVKIHLHNIIGKLGVHNRTEAARFYLDRGGGTAPPIPRHEGAIPRPAMR